MVDEAMGLWVMEWGRSFKIERIFEMGFKRGLLSQEMIGGQGSTFILSVIVTHNKLVARGVPT